MIPHYAPVGAHVSDSDLSAAKTIKVDPKANAILVQAVTQNVRLKLSGAAAAGGGFVIVAGDAPQLIPIGNASISVIEETATGTLEYQFVNINRSL